jgi:muramoyltetrapeptide carboxypeptidase
VGNLRRRPEPLRPGDRVAVVVPSGPCEPDHLAAGCERLRGFGLDVVVGAHALDRSRYLAGDDADRAFDLGRAWCDPSVRAVICARGGYGAARLLPLLDWGRMAEAGPKLLHGSSDVTVLHGAVGARFDLVTSFGPMPANHLLGGPAPDPESLDSLRMAWFSPAQGHRLDGTHALGAGRAEGPVVGGNLSLLAASVGTPWTPPPASGCIVLLEDVGEAPYRVDRLLTQLLQAGWLDGAVGFVLGSWDGCGDDVEETLVERLGPLGRPILAGVAVGHGRPQLTLPLGAPAVLDADAGELVFAS